MAITQIEAKEKLKELSCKSGGSILGKVDRHELNPDSRILFVGIGGVGCQTVNKIKGTYLRKFKETSDVEFLCIDTDERDVKLLKKENGGNIDTAEIFELYNDDAKHLLIKRPPITNDWLSSDVPSETISETGAKSRRVVGRVMLCGTGKYAALESKFKGIFNNFANDGAIEVVVCSGISGGTGSGTFIDISYMLRIILSKITEQRNITTNLYGIFYTPDVQKNVKGVGNNPKTWETLQQNGYAAMKELSYFMNLGGEGYDQNVYSIRVIDPNGSERVCNKPIFERGYSFMISATPQMDKFNEIIECTAESILNMFRPGQIDANNEKRQSIISTLCNIGRNIGTWETDVVGRPENENDLDTCGIKNTFFPAFMNNSFSSFGYRSIYLPKNEIAAFVANRAFKEIVDSYKRAFKFKSTDALYIADCLGIASAEQILSNIKQQMNVSANTLKIDKANYPVRRGFVNAGRVVHCNEAIEAAKEIVDLKIENINDLSTCINSIVEHVKDLLEGRIPFFANGEEVNLWDEYGPVGSNVILAGTDSSGHNDIHIEGIIDVLRKIENGLSESFIKANKQLEEATSNMEAAKTKIEKDLTPHDEEIEAFVIACSKYSEAYFDSSFISVYMREFVSYLRNELLKYSNETFEIYTPIIMCLADILNEDSDAFAKYYLTTNGRQSTFSLNAFNLNQALEKNDLFQKMFEGLIADGDVIKQIKDNLMVLLFSSDERKQWKTYISSPDILCDKLRHVFSTTVNPIVSETLEKFMVLVYGNKDSIIAANHGKQDIDIQILNTIWNDRVLRDNALRTAAENIVKTISGSAMIAFDEYFSVQGAGKLDSTMDMVLLVETPNLNNAIISEMTDKFGEGFNYTEINSLRTEISVFECVRPFSLEVVRNMYDYASEYYKSEQNVQNAAGRHMNEVSEKWQENLPEIYGKDTEDFFMGICKKPESLSKIAAKNRAIVNGKEFNNDITVYGKIKEAVEYGLENGYIYANDDNKYVICVLEDTSDEFIKKLENTILELSRYGQPHTWKDALIKIKEDENHAYYKEILLSRAIVNSVLKTLQTNSPNNRFDLKNIYRIVRSDMTIKNIVFEWYEKYKNMNLFHNADNLSSFDENVSYYILAKKCGMISYDRKCGWICTYSEIASEKPIIFFDDYKQKDEKLDVPFMEYLVFSAFVQNALSDVVKDAINHRFDYLQKELRNGGVIPSCSDVLQSVKDAFSTDLFLIRDVDQRKSMIAKHFAGSQYADYYNIPKRCDSNRDVDTLIVNLNSFKAALENLDETGKL